jgi:hypothetical protein
VYSIVIKLAIDKHKVGFNIGNGDVRSEYNPEVFQNPKIDCLGESSQFIGSEYWLEFALT